MAIHLPLCDIPVRIAPNARTPSTSPLAHLTPPHPPSSDVLVREDREKKPSDYESLTIVHQVTGKGKEISSRVASAMGDKTELSRFWKLQNSRTPLARPHSDKKPSQQETKGASNVRDAVR
ncbi:hypothetical protein D1P53_002952 [Cryptococcus gattii VGV]|nr:hypothetical protein D1P53_002952 [Cryptococcus gattii VGV]